VGNEPEGQIAQAFEIILGRAPEPDELERFKRLEGSLAALCRVRFSSNEFLYVE
jgi:hypothetical protein